MGNFYQMACRCPVSGIIIVLTPGAEGWGTWKAFYHVIEYTQPVYSDSGYLPVPGINWV